MMAALNQNGTVIGWQPDADRTVLARSGPAICGSAFLNACNCGGKGVLPSAPLNSGADYTIDFSGDLDDGERIVNAKFTFSGATIGYQTFLSQSATVWLLFTQAGYQTGVCTIQTTLGNILSSGIVVMVSSSADLIQPTVPDYPPNCLVWGGVVAPVQNDFFLIVE